jgi:predicted nucleotidyltransferase
MADEQTIQELCNVIVRDFQPERIILFGSYAYGNPTPDSDGDLLVVLPFKGKNFSESPEILKRSYMNDPKHYQFNIGVKVSNLRKYRCTLSF